MSPCRCSHLGDPARNCTCTPMDVQRYQSRVLGTLLGRMDIHLNVPPVAYDDLATHVPGEASETICARVEAARERQLDRCRESPGVYANAHMGPRELAKFVRLGAETELVLKQAIMRLGLSARAHHRILKLARTLADL